MSDAHLVYELGVMVPQVLEDETAVILSDLGGSPPVMYYPLPDDGLPMPDDCPETPLVPPGMVLVGSYFTELPGKDVQDALTAAVTAAITSHGLTMAGELAVSLRSLDPDQYLTAWRRFFVPIHLDTLVVAPPWDKPPVTKQRTLLVIQPGNAFGTGQHETTVLCLKSLEALIPVRRPKNLLDVGCGSGILAIAAGLWGVPDLVGVDIDPFSVKESRHNARENGVTARFLPGGPDQATGCFDLVVANVLLKPLVDLAPVIAGKVANGGALVLSGIIAPQEQDLLLAYERQGFSKVATRREGDWLALTLARKED